MNCESLDPRDPGRWPLVVRGFFVALIFVVCAGFAWYLRCGTRTVRCCRRPRRTSWICARQFENKQQRAANLDAYKAQLAEMERSFGAMLRQLPGKTEVPNLLVDISQTGLAAGLTEKLFQPGAEKSNGFYAELPIKIRLVGLLPPVRRVRERHRGVAAHRDAARHPDQRRSMRRAAATTI